MVETLIGLKDLERKLKKLDGAVSEKVLRSAVMNASTPAFKAIKAAAPVGKKAHRTHKGNLVAPGFLRRSIKRFSRIRHGRSRSWAAASIGVRAEAYYGLQFVELGTKKMRARPWFVQAFKSQQKRMEQRFIQQLRAKIMRASR
jgi:HK97 gp10 family phage protein